MTTQDGALHQRPSNPSLPIEFAAVVWGFDSRSQCYTVPVDHSQMDLPHHFQMLHFLQVLRSDFHHKLQTANLRGVAFRLTTDELMSQVLK